jgi:hypothetical protein
MMRDAKRLLLALDLLTHSGLADPVCLHVLSPSAKVPDLGVGRHAAIILEAAGYVSLERSTRVGENRLQITPTGVAEAVRLRLPFWKQWLADKALVAGVISGVIVAAGNGALRLLGL